MAGLQFLCLDDHIHQDPEYFWSCWASFFLILKSLNHPLLCGYDMNLYLDIGTWDHWGRKKIGTWDHQGQKKIGTWDHRARRGLAKSHTASGSPAVQKLSLMSQKYYFLGNSVTCNPNDILRCPTKIAPPQQLFENKQGLNSTHLPIATIRQVQ